VLRQDCYDRLCKSRNGHILYVHENAAKKLQKVELAPDHISPTYVMKSSYVHLRPSQKKI